MSHINLGLIPCPDVQDQLNRAFTDCDKSKQSNYNERSLVEFLAGPTNTDGYLQNIVSPGDAKLRTVQLVYTPRILTNEFTDTPEKVCTTDAQRGMLSESYTVDDVGLLYTEKFDPKRLRTICQKNPDFMGEAILSMIDGATRKMDKDLMNDLTLLVGAYGAGEENVNPATNVKTVSTKLADGSPDPEYLEDLGFAAQNAGYCSVPYAFGWQEAWRGAFRQQNNGCCAQSGLNIDSIAESWPLVMMPNRNVPTSFGTDNFVMVERGAVQLLYWNEFAGDNVVDTEIYKQFTVVDPRTGIPFDMIWNLDCGVWYVSIKLAYKAVGMPTDMYDTGDVYEDVTGVNQLEVSNP